MSRLTSAFRKSYNRRGLLFLVLTLILLTGSNAYSSQVILEWDPNTEPDLAGYMVYYGTSSRDYSCSVDVGNYTTCAISDSNFVDGETFYFAATAYDEYGNESDFSEEVTYTFSVADTDGDGISDYDETNTYGTDPLDADSDTDQMPDGWEVEYGLDPLDPSDAYGDLDGDGLTNLYEYQTGSDPSEPPPVGLGTYDDTNANIVYAGAWHNYRGSSPYNGTLHYSDVVGSTGSLTFTGDGVTLVYTGYSNRGVMRIEIDGVEVASLDQYTSSTEWQQEWSSELLADGEHTLTLTHDSGQIVDVDAIIIGPPPPVGLGTYDDTNANIVYAGAWHNYSGSSPYNGTLHYSDVVGSTASLIFTGDGVTLVYTGYSNRGVMRIEIDGVEVASLDQYTSSTEWQQEWSSELLADGEHTLTLTHDSGQIVDVDAIIIGPPPPVGLGTYDDTNANIVYAGAWHNYSGSDPYNGTLHYSDVVGSTASLIFTGDGVTLVYTGYSNRGVMRIEIDGVEVASLDQYTSSTEWQQEWSSELLADGEHTLTLTHDSGQIVDVDAVIITGTP